MPTQAKTVFITGGSRGIGLAIAKRLAADGANIVIAAKTVAPHARLAGTIFTAAEEIAAAGGRCLPVAMDIRHEASVTEAVAAAVAEFNGIDVLVNNASAISLTGTLHTPMKKYDLMHQVNIRGTYLAAQKCIPHLLKSANPHVLTLSPPLNMDPKWFGQSCAYTMSKYGMSMCVMGMAHEFKNKGIAFNALWPQTPIWTAATAMVGGDMLRKRSRTAAIMADAARHILSLPAQDNTGQFYVDEELLRSIGITDFSHYLAEGATEANLIPDLFL